MKIFTNIKDYFKKLFKIISIYGKSRVVSKQSILSWLDNISQLTSVLKSIFSKMTNTDLSNLRVSYINNLVYIQDQFLKKFPTNFNRALNGKALSLEAKHFLYSIQYVNDRYIKLLNYLQKNLDQLFKSNTITLGGIQISQVSALGIMTDMEKFSEYGVYLLNSILAIASLKPGNSYKPLGYVSKKLSDGFNEFVNTINLVCNKTDKYVFLDDINKFYNASYDFSLNAVPQSSLLSNLMMKVSNFPIGVQFGLSKSLAGLETISMIADMYLQYSHAKYLRNKALKEFMEQRIALLLQKKNDTNSEEIEKIIQKYKDLIAKYDRKINEYESDLS